MIVAWGSNLHGKAGAAPQVTATVKPFWYHHKDGPSRVVTLRFAGQKLTEPARVETTFQGKTFVRQVSPGGNPLDAVDLYLPIENPKEPANAEISVKIGRKTLHARATIAAERKWEVYLVHHTHLDIGYTHLQEEVLRIQVDGLRKAMEYIEASKDYPEDARFKWHPEGMWAIEEFLRTAEPDEKQQFIKAAKDGYIHQDALYAQAMTGLYSEEELIELTGSAKRFEKKYDLPPIVSAMESDIPGHSWGFVTALAHCGVKYLTSGPNFSYRIGHVYEWGDRPFYWKSPSGKQKILFWMAGEGYCWFYGSKPGSRLDPFSTANNHRKEMVRYLRELEQEGYPYDMVQVRYIIGHDNGPPNPALPDFVKEWNQKYAFPKMIIARNSEMCAELEKRYGDKIPVVSGDFTPYWEDGAASSAADLAVNRRAAERLVQAQVLWAMRHPGAFPAQRFDEAWIKIMMYDEHTWGAHCSVSEPESDFTLQQYAYKRKFATDGARMTDELVERAVGEEQNRGSNTVDIYNTTSWTRNGELAIVSSQQSAAGDVVKNVQGEIVPSQRLASGRLAFMPGAVPPFGARRFTIHKGKSTTAGTAKASGWKLDNRRISLEIDPQSGAIKSLRCQGITADLVDSSGKQGINEYLYIRGLDGAKGHHRIEGPVNVKVEDPGPLVATLSIESDAPGCKQLTRKIRIVSGSDLVDCLNVTDKLKERSAESVYFAYPMNVPDGVARIDIPWAVVRPEKDQIKGANRNVFCVQRYVDVSNADYGVTWVTIDAPLLQFDPIVIPTRDRWLTEIEPGQTFYSWVMMNHHGTNYKAYQEGVIPFRYVLAPHAGAYDEAAAQRIARGVHQPLLAFAADPSKPAAESLFRVEGEGVVVTSVKPSRDGKAFMVRLFNTSGETRKARLAWTSAPRETWLSNPMEEEVARLNGPVELVNYEVATLRTVMPVPGQ